MIGYNVETGEWEEFPERRVACQTVGCENYHVTLVLADDGSEVFCGPCGSEIGSNVVTGGST